MKNSIISKVMALFVAVMMLVPMVAQAEGAEYYEGTLSNVTVNYMGTELDFSGLSLKLLGGFDASAKNGIMGLQVGTPSDTNANLALELGESEATLCIANQLVSVPYARFGEAMSKLGLEVSDEYADISEIAGELWNLIIAADEDDGDDDFADIDLEQLDVDLSAVYADLEAASENVVTNTDVEYGFGDTGYTGTETVIELDAETATKLVSDLINAIYGNEATKAAIESADAALEGMIDMGIAEGDLDMSEMYGMIVDNMAKISVPNGIKMTVFETADDAETQVNYMKLDRFTLDLTDYITGLAEATGEELSDSDLENTSFDYEMTNVIIGDDYADMEMSIYMTGAETALSEISLIADGTDDNGTVDLVMSIDPAGLGEEGDAIVLALNYDKTTTDDSANGVATISMTSGEESMGSVTLSYARTDSGDDNSTTNIAVSYNDGTNDMNLFALDYDLAEQEDGDNDVAEINFNMNVADVITVSGNLNLTEMPMSSDKLLTSGAESVLNLADATDEDLSTLVTNVQNELINALSDAMQVSGVATLFSAEDTEDTDKVAIG